MSKSTIMVVLGEHTWTVQAVHLACAVARDIFATVTIVKIVPVNHPLHLGQSSQMINYSREDRLALQDSAATAEDYNVEFSLHVCSTVGYASGLASIAEQLAAAIVLIPPGHSRLVWWNHLQDWWIRRLVGCPVYSQLSQDGQLLIAREMAADVTASRDESAPQVSPVRPG